MTLINFRMDENKLPPQLGIDVSLAYAQINSRLRDPMADERQRTLHDSENPSAIFERKLI